MPASLSLNQNYLIKLWAILASVLVLLSAVMTIADSLAQASNLPTRAKEIIHGAQAIFDLDAELSVPNWFSSLGLCVCAALLMVNAWLARAQGAAVTWRWVALASVLVWLSIDENVGFHERSNVLGRQLVGWIWPSVTVQHAWVVFVPLFALPLGILCWPVFSQLLRSIRNKVILAALVYLGGAVVVEVIGGQLLNIVSDSSLLYAMSAHIEEALEIAGVILFANALLLNIRRQLAGHSLELIFIQAD